jgi:hypothetical protein
MAREREKEREREKKGGENKRGMNSLAIMII